MKYVGVWNNKELIFGGPMFLLYLAGDLYHILVLIGFYRSQSLRQNYMR